MHFVGLAQYVYRDYLPHNFNRLIAVMDKQGVISDVWYEFMNIMQINTK